MVGSDCSRWFVLLVVPLLLSLTNCGLFYSGTEDSAATSSSDTQSPSRSGTTVSYRLEQDRFFALKASLPGKEPLQFILDLSLDESVLFARYARQWNVLKSGDLKNQSDRTKKWVRQFTIGNYTRSYVHFLIGSRSSFPKLKKRIGNLHSYAGVLGHSFLEDLTIEINDVQKTLTISEDGNGGSSKTRDTGSEFRLVNQPENRKFIVSSGTVNGDTTEQFAIDPSSPTSAVDAFRKRDLDLSGSANSGSGSSKFVRIDRLWLFGRLYQNEPFQVVSGLSDIFGNEASFALGKPFFVNKRIRINFQEKNMMIQSLKNSRDQ